MNKIKKSLVLIRNGKGLKSKMIITLFLIGDFLKIKNYEKFIFSDILVQSSAGKFYVRKKSPYDLWMSSDVERGELEDSLNLGTGVFIDIGANIGKYTIKIGNQLKNNGRVISFEPEKDNFKMLKRNSQLNDLKNIMLIKKALSNKKGNLKLFLAKGNLGHHSIIEEVGREYENVEVDTLDSVLEELKIKRVDLIKIDVEGAESLVLEGAKETLKKFHPKIIFEAWDENHLNKVKEILRQFNYKVKPLGPQDYYAK